MSKTQIANATVIFVAFVASLALVACSSSPGPSCTGAAYCAESQAEADQRNVESGCDNWVVCGPSDASADGDAGADADGDASPP